MTWICERCRCVYEGDFPVKIETWRDSDLVAHSVPDNAVLCFGCALYLLWSRIFPGGIRRFWDEYYMTNSCFLGHKSRYSPKCREFDIKYRFLDSGTNVYWDEKDNKSKTI